MDVPSILKMGRFQPSIGEPGESNLPATGYPKPSPLLRPSAPQNPFRALPARSSLRDDGLSYGDLASQARHDSVSPFTTSASRIVVVEQLTFLPFLKMADEQSRPPFNKPSPIPKGKDWLRFRPSFSAKRKSGVAPCLSYLLR